MSKMKKYLLTGLSFVLVAALAIGGTFAYLTSEDSDVNVMTLGNVSIEQHEYQRVENADGTYKTDTIDNRTSYVLEAFEQAKPLLPIVGDPTLSGTDPEYAGYDATIVRMTQVDSYGSMQVFAGKNAQDKFVTVENTGKTDAYVRTLVAIECGTGDASLIGTGTRCVPAADAATSTAPWVSNVIGKITVDNNTYTLFEYVYRGASDVNRHVNGILPAGDTTYPSLCQVYLKSKATNEDMEAIDGNGNGTLDILVLSQAVQTAGFDSATIALDTAFGKSAEKAAEWFGGTVIPVYAEGAEQVEYVLNNGGELYLEEDVSADKYTVSENTSVEIDLQNNTLSGIIENKGEMNVSDGKVEAPYVENYGEATFTEVEFKAGSAYDYASINKNGAATEYTEVTLNSAGGGVAVVEGAKAVFNSGSVDVTTTSTSGRYNFYVVDNGSELVINDGSFSFSKTLNQKRAYVYVGAGATVKINGGTFGPASSRNGYTAGIIGEGTVIITGGTFGFNPSAWVADGYQAVQNGSTWTVVVK